MKKYINYSYCTKKIYSLVSKSVFLSCLIILFASAAFSSTVFASSETKPTGTNDVTVKNVEDTADTPKKVNGFENLGTFKSWEAFSMITTDEVVCWVSSESAVDKSAKSTDKTSTLMLSIRLENKDRDEFSYHSHHNLEEQSKVRLTIDNMVGFDLLPQGHWAWLKSSIDESRFVLAAQKGTSLVLGGKTTKDKIFKESYSLSGFTAAYKVAFDACQSELEKKTKSN